MERVIALPAETHQSRHLWASLTRTFVLRRAGVGGGTEDTSAASCF
jgi:hypothetical protein